MIFRVNIKKKTSASAVGKSPREVTRASWLETFHNDPGEKPTEQYLPLFPPSPWRILGFIFI